MTLSFSRRFGLSLISSPPSLNLCPSIGKHFARRILYLPTRTSCYKGRSTVDQPHTFLHRFRRTGTR